MDLIRLSATKLKTFSSCPKKYYYQYIEKVSSTKHIAAVMGTAVHKTVEQVFNVRKLNPAQEISTREVYDSHWMTELALSPETSVDMKVYNDGVAIVERYDFKSRRPLETEVEFILPFPSKEDALCEIHGFIDQVYQWGFLDMKTSKRKPEPIMLQNDLQFFMYTWAFKELYNEDPRLGIWQHLRTGDDITFDPSKVKLEFLIRIIYRILESREWEIWDRNIGESCMFCSFKHVCLGD